MDIFHDRNRGGLVLFDEFCRWVASVVGPVWGWLGNELKQTMAILSVRTLNIFETVGAMPCRRQCVHPTSHNVWTSCASSPSSSQGPFVADCSEMFQVVSSGRLVSF